MGSYVAEQVIKLMLKNDVKVKNSKVLILGITFKENCPDIRNTKVVDVIYHLKDFGVYINIYDPWACCDKVMNEYSLTILFFTQCDIFPIEVLVITMESNHSLLLITEWR